ncbi:extracellular solute-binding protein [bacterium]|nr:extracellular solute-binding protein [bacterium]
MKIFKTNFKFKILLLVFALLLTSGFQCKCVSWETKEQLSPITLEFWGVWDNSDVFEGIISKYNEIHPNINVQYRKLRYEEYENALLNAWAEGKGPDIFSIHNTWTVKYKNKIAYLPKEIELPYISYKPPLPGCKRATEQVIEVKKKASPLVSDIKNDYVEAVYYDVVFKDEKGKSQIYALPLFLDTLVLFYNRDLLDSANIVFPPADWDEFSEDVRILTKYDVNREIIQSGTAMGTFDNIERSLDILSLLMLQNGVDLNALTSKQYFQRTLEALNFYLDFASPEREVYSWNNDMLNSLDVFAQGKVAFFFGYSYHISLLQAKAPTLDFKIAPVPQVNLSQPVNYANYWNQTVFKRSEHIDEAWNFILFMNEEKNVKKYLEKTKRPTALRSLIEEQENNLQIKPFVSQVLTADCWHGYEKFNYIETVFQEMFDRIYNDEDVDAQKALKSIGEKIYRAK